MICYASMLVEGGFAEEIFLSFLIVGHTHCNLDQNFSVLSKKINDTSFIGSPLAMHELYGVAHKKETDRPSLNIQLQYIYDWADHFKDIVNKEIKYFQVPHRFRISMSKHYNRAICQYMLFTHEDLVTECWLPKTPPSHSESAKIFPEEYYSCSVQLHEFSVVNDLPDLENYLGLQGDITKFSAKARRSVSMSETLTSYLDLVPKLGELEKDAIADQISVFGVQEVGEDPSALLGRRKKIKNLKAELQRFMKFS